MKKKPIIIITSIAAIVVIAVVTASIYVVNEFRKGDIYAIAAQDTFPVLELADENGTAVNLTNMRDRNKVIFNGNTHCRSCLDALPSFRELEQIFDKTDFEFYLIWDNNIPSNTGFAKTSNLSLGNRIRIAASTPSMFVLDKNNTVVFTGVYDATHLAQFLLNFANSSYEEQAVNYVQTLLPSEIKQNSEGIVGIVEFYTYGCLACKNATESLIQKSKELNFSYAIISDDESEPIGSFYDPGILATILDVEKMPTFLTIYADGGWELFDTLEEATDTNTK